MLSIVFCLCVVSLYSQNVNLSSVDGTISACLGSVNETSTTSHFTVTGTGLMSGIELKASQGFSISLSPDAGFSTVQSINHENGAVVTTTVYVRANSFLPLGSTSGAISVETAGLANLSVTVFATINSVPQMSAIANRIFLADILSEEIVLSVDAGAASYSWINSNPAIGLPATGDGSIPAFVAVNNTTNPISATITVTPHANSLAYVPDINSEVVLVADLQQNKVVESIRVGQRPIGVTVSSDKQTVFVTNSDANTVSVIDARSNRVITTIPVGQTPSSVVADHQGSRLYVANYDSHDVTVVDLNSLSVIATISLSGHLPSSIDVSPDGSRVYVSQVDRVSVINTVTNTEISFVPAPSVNSVLSTLVVSPDGKTVYVTNSGSFDNSVSVINTTTNTISRLIPVGSNPFGVDVSPDGRRLAVSNTDSHTISIIDAQTFETLVVTPVSMFPHEINFNADGTEIYVLSHWDDKLTTVSALTGSVLSSIELSSPRAMGVFVTSGSGCVGNPVTFDIVVKPRPTVSPTVTISEPAGYLFGCAGVPSQPAITFSVSGKNFASALDITAPNGFEISLSSATGFASTISVQPVGGVISTRTIYVRTSSNTVPGGIQGNVTISSTYLTPRTVYVTALINPVSTIEDVPDCQIMGGIPTLITANATDEEQILWDWDYSNPALKLAIQNVAGDSADVVGNNPGDEPLIITLKVEAFSACSSDAKSFTVTVLPAMLSITRVRDVTYSCESHPSAADQMGQFALSGKKIPTSVQLSAPAHFEISTARDSGFGEQLILTPVNGVIDSTMLFVRLKPDAPAGKHHESIRVTMSGVLPGHIDVRGIVHALPALQAIPDHEFVSGSQTTEIRFSASGGEFDFAWTNSDPTIGLPAAGRGNVQAFLPINQSTSPVVATITVAPVSAGYVFVPSASTGELLAINSLKDTVDYRIAIGSHPSAVAVSKDGKTVYVGDYDENAIFVVDVDLKMVVRKIAVYDKPKTLLISEDGNTLFSHNLFSIARINLQTNKLERNLFKQCVNVTMWEGANWLVTTRYQSPYIVYLNSNDLSVINTRNHIDRAEFAMVAGAYLYFPSYERLIRTSRFDSPTPADKYLNVSRRTVAMKFSPDLKKLYLLQEDGYLTVVDVASFTVRKVLQFEQSTNYKPYGMTFNTDGSKGYLATETAVYVLDTKTDTVLNSINPGFDQTTLGDFANRATGCVGDSVEFNITIHPEGHPLPYLRVESANEEIFSCQNHYPRKPNYRKYRISGYNLTGPIVVEAPPGFQVATVADGTYTSSLSIHLPEGKTDTEVFVKIISDPIPESTYGILRIASDRAVSQKALVYGDVYPSLGFESITIPEGTINIAYEVSLVTAPLDYAFNAQGLPDGVTISQWGYLTGTPSETFESRQVDITVSNEYCTKSFTTTMKVNKLAASVIVSGAGELVYNGYPRPLQVTTVPFGIAVSILYNNTTTAPKNVGSYSFEVKVVDPTYSGMVSGTMNIRKARLSIVANPLTRKYGEDNPTLTYSYFGLAGGESLSVIDVLPQIATTATKSSNVGIYPVIVSGGSDDQYTLDLKNGSLTVEKLDQPITFKPISDQFLETGSIALEASTALGLNVSFMVISGNAVVNGNMLTLLDVGRVTVRAYHHGSYNINGSSVDQSFDVFTITDTDPLPILTKVEVFPNPAETTVYTRAPVPNVQLKILDVNGKVVAERILREEDHFDISQLSGGIYTLQLGYQGHVVYRRLMIK